MPLPRYRPDDFQPSGWDSGTPERKARFTNALLRFIAADCPEDQFTKPLYDGLYNHGYFGFIAHYDRHGFYAEQLSTPERRARFVRDLTRACTRDAHTDRLDLWSDVKTILARHLPPAEPAPRRERLSPFTTIATRTAVVHRDGEVTLF